jgi:hypothetical protein
MRDGELSACCMAACSMSACASRCKFRASGVEGAGMARNSVLTVKIRQPSHEFTFGVGMSFIPYPLVLTPVV